jgi:hypothetical protein
MCQIIGWLVVPEAQSDVMSSPKSYSPSAVVVATIGWLLLAALSGVLAMSGYLFKLALPLWLFWVSVAVALICFSIATIVPPKTRCRLAEWFQLFS